MGETHPSVNQCKETVPPEDLASAVLPDGPSSKKESASTTTRGEVMSLEEARRQREEKFERSIGLEHWSWCRQTITLLHATEEGS